METQIQEIEQRSETKKLEVRFVIDEPSLAYGRIRRPPAGPTTD